MRQKQQPGVAEETTWTQAAGSMVDVRSKQRTSIHGGTPHGLELIVGVGHKLVDGDNDVHAEQLAVFDVPLEIAAARLDELHVFKLVLVCEGLP
jgi:hypothetical protein